MLGFFRKLASPFLRLQSTLGSKLRALLSKKPDPEALHQLEKLLYEADLGSKLASELAQQLSPLLKDPAALLSELRSRLLSLFPPSPARPLAHPHVILLVGVNGSGKTTSAAKLAERYRKEGKTVLLAACDTFRAAAIEQLETWAQRTGASLVKGKPNGDPSAVAFDALAAAKARGVDLVIIDTAGRLDTKTDLLQELAKIRRICAKQIPEAPHETLLVLDATLGQNALEQARAFHAHTPLTALILTKLDGSAKGGIAAALQHALSLPIAWAGLGETADDFIPFDPSAYVDALLQPQN
jgi:fused signal recognition particle receptor